MELPQRISSKIQKAESGCWEWTGALLKYAGYGVIRWKGRAARAHRVVYMLSGRVIPDGLQLDHLCRNRKCVNPEHLEPVTCLENQRRSPISQSRRGFERKHCHKGHPRNAKNTYTRMNHGSIQRTCRLCFNEWQRAKRADKHTTISLETQDE